MTPGDTPRSRILRFLAVASGQSSRDVELIQLDRAIAALEAHDAELCQIVMLRVFAGLGVEETAALVNRSPRSVKRDWQVAKAWILRWLSRDGRDGGSSPARSSD